LLLLSFIYMAIPDGKERITISLEKEQATWVRVEAAKRKVNTGVIVGELIERAMATQAEGARK
jgi:hypothetical protein